MLDGKISQRKTVAIATVLLYDKGENDERFKYLERLAQQHHVQSKVIIHYLYRGVKRFITVFDKLFKKFFICEKRRYDGYGKILFVIPRRFLHTRGISDVSVKT